MDKQDEYFQIKQSYLATLHMLITYITYQQAFNEEILIMVGHSTKFDVTLMKKRMDERWEQFYQELAGKLFQEYGIVDLDDLLKNRL